MFEFLKFVSYAPTALNPTKVLSMMSMLLLVFMDNAQSRPLWTATFLTLDYPPIAPSNLMAERKVFLCEQL